MSRRFIRGRQGKGRIIVREEEAGWEEVTDTNGSTEDQQSGEGSWWNRSALCGQTAGAVHEEDREHTLGKGRAEVTTLPSV